MAVETARLPAIPARPGSYRARRVLLYVLLALVSALFFTPFLWTISTALKTLPETTGFDLLPDNPTLEAFRQVLTEFNFARFALNSFILAGTITVANLVLCSLGGYAFARLHFPGRELLFMLVLATLMIPDQLRLVPVFQMLTGWGLIGSFWGFIAIQLVLPTQLFLMRQYFLTIPRDFEEAAKLDNAGYFKTYWKVMLPLAAPALAAVTILTFQGMWNDFFWSLIILGFGDPDVYTIQLGLAQFRFQYQTLWPQLMAASALAILPIAVIYVFFQRYFVAGVVASGVKG
jgi:ABC-type glycerol-3-phosphate transport system permease component